MQINDNSIVHMYTLKNVIIVAFEVRVCCQDQIIQAIITCYRTRATTGEYSNCAHELL